MAVIHSLYSEAGQVSIDHDLCSRCGECTRICPGEVLVLCEGRVVVAEQSPFGCIACGHCMMVCPRECIAVTGRDLSPADLLPLPVREERATPAALEALFLGRRSVRRFTGEELDPELLRKIVTMASEAPMGIPPWDVGCAVVGSRQGVQELAGEVVAGYAGMLKVMRPWLLALLRPLLKRTLYERLRTFILPLGQTYVAHRRAGRDVLFYDAPAVLIFHHSPYADAVDAAIACTHAMLAAESLGLGTTIIGAAAPILQRNPALCAKLGIPAGNVPAIALIVGRPAAPFRRALRRRFIGVTRV